MIVLRVLGVLGVAVLNLVVLVLAALTLVLNTDAGQARLPGLIEAAMSGPGSRVEVGRLSGSLPIDLRLDRFVWADEAGPWLQVDDARFAWRPNDLLRGRITVAELAAERVALRRLPPSQPEPETPSEPFRLPRLPESLPAVALERLHVGALEVGAPLLGGEAATFALDGRLGTADDGRAAGATLDLRRTDQTSARAGLDARLDLAAERLNLDLDVEETGGLVGRLAGRPDLGAVRLTLRGDGPLRDWAGRLDLDAAGLAKAGGDVRLALTGTPTPSLGLDLGIEPAPGLLPADAARALGERIGVALRVVQTAPQRIGVRDVRLTTAPADLTARADLDLDARTVTADARLNVPDLGRLAPLAGRPLAGRLALDLRADGPLAGPRLDARIEGDDVAANGVALRTITTLLAARPALDADGRLTAVGLTGEGRADGVRLDQGPALPSDSLTWTLAANAPLEGAVVLDRLNVRGLGADVAGRGALDPEALTGRGRLDLTVADLRPFARLAGQTGAGRLDLHAEANAGDDGRAVFAVKGRAERLADLPPAVAGLLGERVTLDAGGAFAPGVAARLDRLDLRAGGLTLTGEAAAALKDGPVRGRIVLDVPDLSVASAAAGQPLAGRLNAAADLSGTAASPGVNLVVAGRDVAASGVLLDRLDAAVTGADLLKTPAGRVNLTAVQGPETLNLRSSYKADLDSGRLDVADLALTAPATKLTGRATVGFEGPTVDADLRGGVADLAALKRWHRQDLAGRLGLDVRLRPEPGGQSVAAAVTVEGVRGVVALDGLKLDAAVTDAFRAPNLDVTAALDGFVQGANRVDRARVTAKGPLTGFALDASASGEAGVDFTVATRADVGVGEATTVALTRLDGRVDGRALRLEREARLRVAGGAIDLADLDLTYAGARLTGRAAYGPDAVDAALDLGALPLPLLAAFGAPPLEGTAGGAVRLSGPLAAPRATANVTVDGLRADDPSLAGVPAARVRLDAGLADRRARVDLRVEGLTDAPIRLNAGLPVVFGLEPFAFAVPEDGELDGALAARADLARVGAMIGLDGQRIAGLLDADLRLAGRVNAPQALGAVTLRDGAYENGETGTVLRNIAFDLRGTEGAVVLESLTADDGADGRVRGRGRVGLDPRQRFPFDFAIGINEATLVRRADATAVLSGDVTARGTSAGAEIGGTVTVNQADIGIPDVGGPDITVVAVEERGEAPPPTEAAAPAFDARLNLRVAMPGQVFVRGRGLDSEWYGNLTIRGAATDPVIVGQIEVRRGTLDALDKRFDLRKGVVTFDGASPPVPALDIEAVTDAEEITAVVGVQGPATEPEITLTSEPELPQDEVLSRLLFGEEASGLTPAQAAKLAFALSELTGGGGGGGLDVLGTLRGGLGLDTLDVGGTGPEDVSVSAGKYLNDRTYLQVQQGLTPETSGAKVEVEITPDLNLEAEVNQQSQTGVGLNWTHDY